MEIKKTDRREGKKMLKMLHNALQMTVTLTDKNIIKKIMQPNPQMSPGNRCTSNWTTTKFIPLEIPIQQFFIILNK